MRVTATELTQWADTREAQGMLPILVRRLISATAETKTISMPGGDSVSVPGWDGVMQISRGCPWVPEGMSYWELGVSKDPASKASSDFNKRKTKVSAEEAKKATYIFVTPRRWLGKKAWQEKARKRNVWEDILVWDADDLEVWLESSPTTALWLAMQLGLAGHGIEAVESYWEHWRDQSNPAVSVDALICGRSDAWQSIKKHIEQREPLIPVQADSQSEAVAFVCAMLIREGCSYHAACLTSEEGWQFVGSNPGIELVVITDNRFSSRRAPREGMTLVVPVVFGDQSFNLIGIGGTALDYRPVELRRPRQDQFEKNLVELGISPSDAARYSRTMGRSWTVFRRWYAQNPAIRKPNWSEASDSTSLVVLTLVGAWNSSSDGDKSCVSRIADRPYEKIEAELLGLAALDDSPVLKIGALWKAKAPLELLHFMVLRMTDEALARFFEVAKAIFEKPDPVLELDDNDRWMASIYGKVREQSGVVLEAIAESIAKLGYFADAIEKRNIKTHVLRFVYEIMGNASAERWLSVSPFLRSFAEAAPDEFLHIVEQSLSSDDKPVVRLISETQGSGISNRCWHAELLWSLELLAWYPARLSRVANILAALSQEELKGNWSNSPFNSLVSLFRAWYPQTAASVELRLRAVKSVVKRYPDVAWSFLLALLPGQREFATENAKPRWRDEDAGAGYVVTYGEIREFVIPISQLLIEEAQGYAERISDLIPRINELGDDFREAIIQLIEESMELPDKEREVVRGALRRFLSWQNSFNRDGSRYDRSAADTLRPLFDSLAADDPVARHAWVFSNTWVELPDGGAEDYKAADEHRAELRTFAIREIYLDQGWKGVQKLVDLCRDPGLVGRELVNKLFDRDALAVFVCEQCSKIDNSSLDMLVSSVLHSIPREELFDFLEISLSLLAKEDHRYEERASKYLVNAPQCMTLWELVDRQSAATRDKFWLTVRPFCFRSDIEHLVFCIEKLLSVRRPRTALETLGDRAAEVACELLVDILEGIAAGEEESADFPSEWNISRVFKALSDVKFDRSKMVNLELTYYRVLEHSEYGLPHLMSEVLCNPESFMEFICLVYKPHNSKSAPLKKELRPVAEIAGDLLHNGRGVPGRGADGRIDRRQFFTWIDDVRKLAKEHDREIVTDQTIGAWLSSWPIGEGLECWPDSVVAELLDQDDCENLRTGFQCGVRNSRGVTSRSPYAGGEQERTVAEGFRKLADFWRDSKPVLSHMIDSLAKSYDHEAKMCDEAGLWNQEN